MTKRSLKQPLAVVFISISVWQGAAAAESCSEVPGVAVQILGSGGPIAGDARASTGYVVWIDGESRALIDAGGGTFLRFGEAGARFTDLDFVGLSHFHAEFLAGTNGTPMLTRRKVALGEPAVVYTSDDLVVEALRVPHGIALAEDLLCVLP